MNLRGPVFLVQEALPHLEKSPYASVVNVISAGAFLFSPDVVDVRGGARPALMSFTRSMAAEFAPRGIRVNALAPGHGRHRHGAQQPARGAAGDGATPGSCAAAADPDEMVGPALFLASDASSFMTGQVLLADGGLVPH